MTRRKKVIGKSLWLNIEGQRYFVMYRTKFGGIVNFVVVSKCGKDSSSSFLNCKIEKAETFKEHIRFRAFLVWCRLKHTGYYLLCK